MAVSATKDPASAATRDRVADASATHSIGSLVLAPPWRTGPPVCRSSWSSTASSGSPRCPSCCAVRDHRKERESLVEHFDRVNEQCH